MCLFVWHVGGCQHRLRPHCFSITSTAPCQLFSKQFIVGVHACFCFTFGRDVAAAVACPQVQVSDAFLLRAKWNMEAHFPDLEGWVQHAKPQ